VASAKGNQKCERENNTQRDTQQQTVERNEQQYGVMGPQQDLAMYLSKNEQQ